MLLPGSIWKEDHVLSEHFLVKQGHIDVEQLALGRMTATGMEWPCFSIKGLVRA